MRRLGSLARMSTHIRYFRGRRLTPLVAVTVAALAFAVVLLLVRLRWRPLESVDHGTASDINNLIAGQHALVTIVKDVSLLGGTIALSAVVAAGAILLLLRRQWKLATYLVVTGAGALVLDPVLKSLVGRLRPVLAHPVAHAPGNSFPSGHALGSLVCYGAIFVVFIPAARGRLRTVFTVVIAVLVALIGISRILLGVHYLSDVLGGWAIGVAWLGVTTVAFEVSRRAAGRPVTHPVAEGLEPEAAGDLELAQPERDWSGPPGWRSRVAGRLLVAWVLILGVIVGLGELVVKEGNGNDLGDRTIPRWLAAHRTPTLNRWSLVFSTLGGTVSIIAGAAVICLVFVGITRRWRPAVYVATLLLGELATFLTAAAIVRRPRPAVPHLDHNLPTSSYPSGHEAATCCLYIGLAVLVIGHARGWWRWLFLIPAIAFPVLVAISRMYRGEHHPTDIAGSLVFAALWIPAVSLLIKPNAVPAARARPSTGAVRGRLATWRRSAPRTPRRWPAARPGSG